MRRRCASSPSLGHVQLPAIEGLPQATATCDVGVGPQDDLVEAKPALLSHRAPPGVSKAMARRLKLDATMSPSVLALRMNHRNIINEMRVNNGNMLSSKFQVLKPRRKLQHQKSRVSLPPIAEVAQKRSPDAAPEGGLRREFHSIFSRQDSSEGFPMEDSRPVTATESSAGGGDDDEIDKLLEEPHIGLVFSALENTDRSGLPRTRVHRTLEAVGHMSPDMVLVEECLRSIPGIEPLGLRDFAQVVAVCNRQHMEIVHERFKRHDSTGRGSISFQELRPLIRDLGFVVTPKAITELIAEIGVPQPICHTTELTLSQFENAIRIIRTRYGFSTAEEKELEALFDKYDQDRSQDMAAEELSNAMGWLGQPTTREQAEAAIERFDIDGNNRLCKPEFLLAVQWWRQEEVANMRTIFFEQDVNGDGIMLVEEISRLLETLGYTISSEVIEEAMKKVKSHAMGLFFEEVLQLIQKVREQEGFSDQEVEELTKVFHKFDRSKKGCLREFELAHAFNWLGYPLSKHRRDELWCRVDTDRSGTLETREFLKLLRLLREEEIATVRKLLAKHIQDKYIQEQDLKNMLHSLGYAPSQAVFEEAQAKVLSPYGSDGADATPIAGAVPKDMPSILSIMRHIREAEVIKLRANAGLSNPKYAKLKSKFGHRLEEGNLVDPAEFVPVICTLFPSRLYSVTDDHLRLHKLVHDNDMEKGAGSLADLCSLAELYNEASEEEEWKRDRELILSTGFKPLAIAQFREAFVAVDGNSNGYLSSKEILSAFGGEIVLNQAQTDKLCRELLLLGPDPQCDFAAFVQLMQVIFAE